MADNNRDQPGMFSTAILLIKIMQINWNLSC